MQTVLLVIALTIVAAIIAFVSVVFAGVLVVARAESKGLPDRHEPVD
jgi:hypothetical protein